MPFTTSTLVSFTFIFTVVTQCFSPLTASHRSSAFLSLKLTNEEQVSIFWKPGLCCGFDRKHKEKYDWHSC